MSRTFTSKTSTTSRGRGRGTNSSNLGRGSIINSGEKQQSRSRSTLTTAKHLINPAGKTTRGTSTARGATSTRGGSGRGATMYNNDTSFRRDARRRTNSQGNLKDQDEPASTDINNETNEDSNQDRTANETGFTMVSPNEKKRRAITEQAKKNLEDYERHKEERKIQHVSYVGTAGGGLVSEEEARKKAAIEHSKASYNSRTKRESYRAAEKEKEEMVYRERKMAARRQSELNEEKRKKDGERHKDEMRRKNAAFLDRLEANKPKPTISNSNPEKEFTRADVSVPTIRSGAQASSTRSENYVNDIINEDLNRLQIMFPDYTRTDLSELLQQMGSLELTIDILSE